jgi:hypothetical protein
MPNGRSSLPGFGIVTPAQALAAAATILGFNVNDPRLAVAAHAALSGQFESLLLNVVP